MTDEIGCGARVVGAAHVAGHGNAKSAAIVGASVCVEADGRGEGEGSAYEIVHGATRSCGVQQLARQFFIE